MFVLCGTAVLRVSEFCGFAFRPDLKFLIQGDLAALFPLIVLCTPFA